MYIDIETFFEFTGFVSLCIMIIFCIFILVGYMYRIWPPAVKYKNLLTTAWFSISFWKYLLKKPKDKTYTNWWNRFWCRAAGHPDGPWWYNPCGFEPDMRCKNCHDEL